MKYDEPYIIPGWWFGTLFIFSIYWEYSSQLTFICSEGWLNHQPVIQSFNHHEFDDLIDSNIVCKGASIWFGLPLPLPSLSHRPWAVCLVSSLSAHHRICWWLHTNKNEDLMGFSSLIAKLVNNGEHTSIQYHYTWFMILIIIVFMGLQNQPTSLGGPTL